MLILYHYNKEKKEVKSLIARVSLNIPLVGKVLYKSHILQFAQAMELLLTARVSIVESISLTTKMVRLYPLSVSLAKMKEDILKGAFFYESMEKQGFFDSSMIALVKIGEEVNQLDRIFGQLTKQYESELDYQSGILISFLEPLMILLLALIVSVILIAMYLPMFKIGTVIQ